MLHFCGIAISETYTKEKLPVFSSTFKCPGLKEVNEIPFHETGIDSSQSYIDFLFLGTGTLIFCSSPELLEKFDLAAGSSEKKVATFTVNEKDDSYAVTYFTNGNLRKEWQTSKENISKNIDNEFLINYRSNIDLVMQVLENCCGISYWDINENTLFYRYTFNEVRPSHFTEKLISPQQVLATDNNLLKVNTQNEFPSEVKIKPETNPIAFTSIAKRNGYSEIQKLVTTPGIENADLSNCGITSFPIEIFQLTSLKQLMLDENYFTSIPSAGLLPILEELGLWHTPVYSLDLSIFPSLKILHLTEYQFKNFSFYNITRDLEIKGRNYFNTVLYK